MRMLLISALFATSLGCSCPIPPQALPKACTSKGCFNGTAAHSPLTPVSFKAALGQPAKKTKTLIVTKTNVPLSAQPSGVSDPVLNKATTAVAAKMENPASTEFEDMKRAIRKDTFGQPIDTICGHVKGKKASGEETGERPFLYLVKEDKAFVDDGNSDSVAATAYRTICISPELHEGNSHQSPNRE